MVANLCNSTNNLPPPNANYAIYKNSKARNRLKCQFFTLLHEEVPKEEARLQTFGVLKEQQRDQHLAITHNSQPKKRMQGNGGHPMREPLWMSGLKEGAGAPVRE
jgi:hypothetical protein